MILNLETVVIYIRPEITDMRKQINGLSIIVEDEDKPVFRIAPAVPSIIPGSIVTPGLLSFILVNKFCDHLPFYRQEKRF
jgi:transposase